MTVKELKYKVYEWVNQIGVYNEGCMCTNCTLKIKDEINKVIDEYLKQIRHE